MEGGKDKNYWLKQIEAGEEVRSRYYLPQDVASETILLVRMALRTGKSIHLQVQDDVVYQCMLQHLTDNHFDPYRYRGDEQRIPLATIIKWRTWLKTDLHSASTPMPPPHPVLTYMQALHAPIYQNYSWADLDRMMAPAGAVMQLSTSDISGDPEEYRLLRRTVRRMMKVWRPQYQALLALNLFGPAIATAEQKLRRLVYDWYNELLDSLMSLESIIADHNLEHATRLDQHPGIQNALQRLGHLYDRINQSEVLAFKLEDTAHYLDAVRRYAVDVCSRLRLGIDIIDTEEGFLHWLHNYHKLDERSQEIIDRLRLYPAERWGDLLEAWYFEEIIKKHDSHLPAPSDSAWQDMWRQHLDIESQSVRADLVDAAMRCRQALTQLINNDDDVAHQLLRLEASQVKLTYGDIYHRHPELARQLWSIGTPGNSDIVITDSETMIETARSCYMVSDDGQRLAIPTLSDHGRLTDLPVAQRLPVARALAYHLSMYADQINLLVLKGRLVISTISPQPLAQRITSLGRQFIRQSEISEPIADITDHLLASDVKIEVWIEGPLVDNRKYRDTADQYRLIQLLRSSGYTVLTIDDLRIEDIGYKGKHSSHVYDLPDDTGNSRTKSIKPL